MAIQDKEVFVEGEQRIGQYMVFIVRQTSDGQWSADQMALDAMITNYRVLLRPTRKKYAPATIPAHYIASFVLTKKGAHHCVALALVTGHDLFLSVGTGRIDHLHRDLMTMKAPSRPKYQVDEAIAKQDIERLITFFNGTVTFQQK